MAGIDGEAGGDKDPDEQLYHRVELVKISENEEDELFWLAGGKASEIDTIRRYTTREYLSLLKYTVDNLKPRG